MAECPQTTVERVLAESARAGCGWVCWACAEYVTKPVVKRRKHPDGLTHGVYHKNCKAANR